MLYNLLNKFVTLALQKVRNNELGDAVVLDADNNTVHSEYDDVAAMPTEVVSNWGEYETPSIL